MVSIRSDGKDRRLPRFPPTPAVFLVVFAIALQDAFICTTLQLSGDVWLDPGSCIPY